MALFHYRALGADGRRLTGTLQAPDTIALAARLREAGAWLLDARETAGASTGFDTAQSRVSVRRSDLIGFFLQMSLLLKAGVTLPQALERLAADSAGTPLGNVIATLREQVTIGVPLNVAMQQFPRTFPRHTTAMVEAGEACGQVPEVFSSLTTHYEWLDQLVSDIRQALVYPVMVCVAATALVLLLFTVVVPRFVGLLLDLNLEVPLLTRIVMAISDALVSGWPVVLAIVVGGPIALKLSLKSPSFAQWWDRQLMRVPIFGPLVSMFALSRFAQNLAQLYRTGVPLLRGLEITRDLVGNRAVAASLDDVRTRLQEGQPLHKGMADHDVFPPSIVTMVATGETSGSLDTALQGVADYYNKLVPRRIKLVFAIFNPAIMLILIGIIAIVALAVLLPILQLWNIG